MRSFRVVVAQGLRENRLAAVWWGGSLGALNAMMAAIWPSIEGSVGKLMSSYPEGLKRAFGIETLNTVEKYIDAEMLSLIVPLALAFFAITHAVRATVAAEERGHLDVVLALPLRRWVLVAGSVAVTAILLAAILAVMLALTLLAGVVVGAGMSAAIIGRGTANVWPLAMAFAGLATLLGGVTRHPGRITAIAGGTLFAMYAIDVVGKLTDSVSWIRSFSAFRWYGSAVQHGLDLSHVAGLTLTGLALAVAGAVLFERRDI